jgi:hypothetical protein
MNKPPFSVNEIDQARRLLGLGERASIGEIKTAYRQMCKKWHPDVLEDEETANLRMKDINAAYRLLLNYCEAYRVSFSAEEVESFDPEKWWYQRFGDNIYTSPDEGDSDE